MTGATPAPGAVAIVGMAGRFPGADNVDSLWRLLLEGTEAVRRFTRAELEAAGVPTHHIEDPNYRPFAADLTGIEDFDTAFFGTPPAEARLMDPQHRIFLECVWKALEDASTPPSSCQGSIGVFGSSSLSSYLLHHVLSSAEYRGQAYSYPVMLGNNKDFLATRVSYRLGLRGPSMTVQSGCSSSLVAVDLARAAVLSGQCEVAVAGGVSIFTPQTAGYLYQQGGPFSADGHCRPFDAAASGMLRGSGCGVVVLKRLEQALADRDHIYAVIAGTAVNNDGSFKAGYTAPSVSGQVDVIQQALAVSDVPASAIGYVEAHGTGTFLGDPIEVAALTQAYTTTSDPVRECALGSVKANVGHLDAAAGITGLIKAALVLHHQTIPPQINFTQPNPELGLAETPFTIHTRTHRPGQPLGAAAVTSLGIGGTNAHCILTAPPPVPNRAEQPAGGEYVLLLSAPEDRRLASTASDLATHLERNPTTRLDDLAYSLAVGREPLPHRAAVTATTLPEAVTGLRALTAGESQEDPRVHAWRNGTPVHAVFVGEVSNARKIRIPGIRFHRERHWIEAPTTSPESNQDKPQQQSTTADLVSFVAEMFSARLGIDSVGPDDDYFALGGESLVAVSLVDSLCRQLALPLTLPQFTRLRTPRLLAEWAAAERTAAPPAKADTPSSLHLVKDGIPGHEVFLVHPSGGTTLFAHALASHSTDPGSLYAIAYPADLTPPLTSISAMARHYVALIRTVAPHGPYRIGGYSLGGMVALEMAHLLTQAGEQVEKIILLDTLPPQVHARDFSDEEFLRTFPALLATTLGLPQPAPALAQISTPEKAIEAVRQPNWSPATVRELRSLYDVWRISARALSTHRPHPYSGQIHLLAAAQPLPPGQTGLPSTTVSVDDWRPYLTGDLYLTTVPGDHFSMFHADHLPALTAAYDRALQQTSTRSPHITPSASSRPTPPKDRCRPVAWLFAGQGTQHPGMGHNLLTRHPELVREADDILGYSTEQLCAGDPDRPLTDTAYAQPAIYVVNALAARQHHEETGQQPDLALGHSLGEYNALEAAGVFSFGDGLRLVAARAAAMARIHGGGMLALTGIPEQCLQALLATDDFQRIDLAAVNTAVGHTLAGPETELDRLTPLLLANGARAARKLNVSGPFHSRYMHPATDALRAALQTITFNEPAIPVLANTTAHPHQHHNIPAALITQLTHTVRWRHSVEHAITEHAPHFHEIGDQHILTPMTTHIQAALASKPTAPKASDEAGMDKPCTELVLKRSVSEP
ncbi:beta-ketoacyl synthase N-terminal-like domain-containing protein [Streptomyces sp. NPDC015127]|uniref:beta-ketoacyl synthase N-terminal-like domain-containing protein n=1 Tax=Streptomyces sp. NPDC015127 TaxID=3364939 RepID=UPI0036F99F97